MEERLWKRYKWEFPPENETCTCWWVANLESEDQTVDAKLICRSVACIRMELCTARLATSQKLRQEWDKRLENNSLSVHRIQANRDIWLRAGGCDPEVLNTPTEIHLEAVARTVNTLNAMLEKYGPRGGLDSFVEEIQNATSMLKVVSSALRSFVQCVCVRTRSSIPKVTSLNDAEAGRPSETIASGLSFIEKDLFPL